MNQETTWDKVKFKIYALILIGIIAFGAIIAGLAYQKAFTSSIPVTLHASRAGLVMNPGNRVKVQGVDLGRVKTVDLNSDQSGVDIVVYVDPELARQVPINVKVALNQLTAFGNKTVEMTLPANPSPQHLAAGTVLNVDSIAGEINGTFEQLTKVLTEIQPSKLNAVLGALAGTLQGKGDSLGATLTSANSYLKKFNGNLPALQRDFKVANGFANVYADAAPNIASLLGNLGVTSKTLVDIKPDLTKSFSTAAGLGNEINDFFSTNAGPLNRALESLRPTTSLLKQYSPALTCFLDGAAHTYDSLNTGGFNESGVQFELTFQPGVAPYQYPQDLPEHGPGMIPGPNCHGLPDVKPNDYYKSDINTGPRSVQGGGNGYVVSKQPALVQFFGPDAYLPSSPKKGGK